ncbi:transposable element Tcb2 transposase [Trichonephila clavipes]|nr:transposable element Tcb2 transposase [Trichonephila clavipes]
MLNGQTKLHIFDRGSVTRDRYCEEVFLPHMRLLRGAIGPDLIFMDDNARSHWTLAVEELLESENITRMDWPVYSPDLNAIEHVWDALGRRIAARLHHPENTQQLKQMLIEEWALLPQEMLHQLVLSMRRRNGKDVMNGTFLVKEESSSAEKEGKYPKLLKEANSTITKDSELNSEKNVKKLGPHIEKLQSEKSKQFSSSCSTPVQKKNESYAITPVHSSFVSYDISEIKSDDSDDDGESNLSKPIPSWANGRFIFYILLFYLLANYSWKQVAAVVEWYRYRTVACLVTSSSPVPLKTRHVGQRCTLNLSRAETSSRWCGVVVRRGGCQLRCLPHHLTMVFKITWSVAKSPRIAEQCDVNIQSISRKQISPKLFVTVLFRSSISDSQAVAPMLLSSVVQLISGRMLLYQSTLYHH